MRVEVSTLIKVYELDGDESDSKIELRSVCIGNDRVSIVVGGHEYEVVAADLIDAAKRCSGVI